MATEPADLIGPRDHAFSLELTPAQLKVVHTAVKAMLDEAELATAAKELQAPLDLVREVSAHGKLPVVVFCAGGIATPADASLVMQLGAEGVFVGSGIFKSSDPAGRAAAIVEATTHFADAERVARASEGLGEAMTSLESRKLDERQLLANRGW